MAGLFRTTEENGHYHIYYLSEIIQEGSIDDEHSHPLIFDEAIAADPMSMDLPFLLQEVNKHSHTLIPIPLPSDSPEKLPKESDLDNVTTLRSLDSIAESLDSDSIEKGEESQDFYKSNQWDESRKAILEASSRAAHTYNEILPAIQILSGHQRKNRTDIKAFPIEGGDEFISNILNYLFKDIQVNNNFEYEESEAFVDQLIVRGMLNTYIDYSDNIQGDIKVERVQWDSVHFGRHLHLDLRDCEYLVKSIWLSWNDVKARWPEKADDINKEINFLSRMGAEGRLSVHGDSDEYPVHGKKTLPFNFFQAGYVDIAKKEYKVMEFWRKIKKNVTVVLNAQDNFYFSTNNLPKKDSAKVKSLESLTKIPTVKKYLRKTVIAGGTVLEDTIEDYLDIFPIVPLYAYKSGDDFWGKVELMKDPQRETNKRMSQVTDILNKAAAYLWYVDDETFDNQNEKDDFVQNASAPGAVIKVRNTNHIPVKAEGVKFPGEIIAAEAVFSEKMRRISGINLELMGAEGNATSGVAIARRQFQALLGNENIFDNLSLAKRQLGRLWIKYIQKIYTPERIYRIMENNSKFEDIQIGTNEFSDIDKSEIISRLSQADLGRYDVMIVESPNNPTIKFANYLMLAELAQQGVRIPEELLILLSPLPKQLKEQAMEILGFNKQQQAQMENQTSQGEIIKSIKDPQLQSQIIQQQLQQQGPPAQ